MRLLSTFLLLFAGTYGFAQNQVPVISNVSVTVGSGQVNITYDLTDAESNACDVTLLLSNNGGQTYTAKAGTITGAVGAGIAPGTGKQITWNYDTVSNASSYMIRIVADDRQIPSIQDLVNSVDSMRLKADMQWIEGIRHYQADSVRLKAVRDSLVNKFNAANLQTERQQFVRVPASFMGENIIGRKPGLGKEDTSYIVDAHYDSVEDAPGADDNGSGVCGVLEVLRVLAPYNFTKTIRFIGFDFEESVGANGGLAGSMHYVKNKPYWEKIQGVNNFEMIGFYSEDKNSQGIPFGFEFLFPNQYAEVQADSFRGNFITNVGAGNSYIFANAYDSLSALYVPALKVITTNLPGNGTIAADFRRSDHAPFWDSSITAIMLTDGANFRNDNYHTPFDNSLVLNYTFMTNVIKGSVATIATLAGLQHSSYKDAFIGPAGLPASNLTCNVNIYPVPVKSTLSINAGDCFNGNYTIRIVNLEGKELITENVTNNNNLAEVSTNKLPAGVYFAVLQNGTGNVVKRFIKE